MSVIYKIYCKDENIKDCYVGSTNDLHKRKNEHKNKCNNSNSKEYNYKVYEFIRANGGFENFDFMILEQFENKMIKQDLLKIEGQYIKNNNTTLNSNVAGRTVKDYKEENKEKMQKYHKEYYEENKKNILEYAKNYREDNKKQINEKKKANYEDNKEKILEKQKEYYQKNKEKRKEYYEDNKQQINEKRKEKVECIYCKALITNCNILRHQRTIKCLSFQNTNQI